MAITTVVDRLWQGLRDLARKELAIQTAVTLEGVQTQAMRLHRVCLCITTNCCSESFPCVLATNAQRMAQQRK
jgi:hypothetical protein